MYLSFNDGGTMHKVFNSSVHPRDEYGRFTEKGIMELTEEDMSDFVDRIDNLLVRQKKKRSDLYEMVKEINSHSMYDWTRRNTVPAADIAVKIADCLATSVEYLVTGKERNIYKEKYDNLISGIEKVIEETKNN